MRLGLFRNSLATSGGALLRSLIVLGAHPILLHFVGLKGYGEWAVLNSLFFLLTLADGGVSQALTILLPASQTQARSRLNSGPATAAAIVLRRSLVLAFAIWIIAPPLSAWMFEGAQHQYVDAIRAIALALPFRVLQQLFAGWEAGIGRYDLQALGESIATTVLFGGVIVLAVFDADLSDFGKWYAIASVAAVGIHALLLRGEMLLSIFKRPDTSDAKELRSLGWGFWPTLVAGAIFGHADRLVVNGFLGAESVGIYALATSMAAKINELSAMPLRPFLHEFSIALDSRDDDHARRKFVSALRVNEIIVVALAGSLICSGPLLSTLLGTPASVATMQAAIVILAVVYGTYSLNAPGFFLLLADRSPHIVSFWSWSGSLLSLGAVALAAYRFGVLAAAAGNIFYAVVLYMNVIAARRVNMAQRPVVVRMVVVFVSLSVMAVIANVLLNVMTPLSLVIAWAFIALVVAMAVTHLKRDFLRALLVKHK